MQTILKVFLKDFQKRLNPFAYLDLFFYTTKRWISNYELWQKFRLKWFFLFISVIFITSKLQCFKLQQQLVSILHCILSLSFFNLIDFFHFISSFLHQINYQMNNCLISIIYQILNYFNQHLLCILRLNHSTLLIVLGFLLRKMFHFIR